METENSLPVVDPLPISNNNNSNDDETAENRKERNKVKVEDVDWVPLDDRDIAQEERIRGSLFGLAWVRKPILPFLCFRSCCCCCITIPSSHLPS